MANIEEYSKVLTSGAMYLLESVEKECESRRHQTVGINHWLAVILRRLPAMVEKMSPEMDVKRMLVQVERQLGAGDTGGEYPFGKAVEEAAEKARARDKAMASERDLVEAVLARTTLPSAGPVGNPGQPRQPNRGQMRATPTLNKYGRNLTLEAAEGRLGTVVGRDEEIDMVIETLCRRSKRNPVLVGPAGVGKTAIVEGLAQRIQQGTVPEPLRGCTVFGIQPSILAAGASLVGEFEERMKDLVKEASQDGIILFIDELHSVVGAGGKTGSSDFASLLKPVLARGEIACIGATTDDEYRRYIEPDSALERRFQPVRVQEMTPMQTISVLQGVYEDLARLRGVTVTDEVLAHLVDLAEKYLKNRHFPDKAVDLLEQCIAHAVAVGSSEVSFENAEEIVQRMVGIPLSLETRLEELKARITEMGLLGTEQINALVDRLAVTMRGLDIRMSRPNAVVLLVGDAAKQADLIADTMADALFGASERVVSIDFSRFVHANDITMLIGAPPGYVGYSESLPLHRVLQMPWCVLRCDNIDICHPHVREVLRQGIDKGSIVDAQGRPIYLSDTIVLLTAHTVDGQQAASKKIGFVREDDQANTMGSLADVLGPDFEPLIDVVCAGSPTSREAAENWIRKHLLDSLGDRYLAHGIQVRWDPTLVSWLARQTDGMAMAATQRKVEQTITPPLIKYLQKGEKQVLVVKCTDGGIVVEQFIEEGDEKNAV